MDSLGILIKGAFKLFQTPIILPWFGKTTPLYMFIFLALLSTLISFINRMLGGDGSDDNE